MKLKLTIDGIIAVVQSGATILDAAKKAGATIPTLCHEDGLHPYGACRICMIEVEGPPRRMLPACTTPAGEGMSVLTRSPAVIEARKAVLELLLINHPLDCPVCDAAGDCRLQDLVHEYGLGPEIFAEEKRTSAPDYASPLIERNQNRCILCGKCVRVCRERVGAGALTFSFRGGRSRISIAFDRPLDCEFCGECIELCPVGALTSKQGKHRTRPWNVERTASTCFSCGCGCPIAVETRMNEIVRVRADENHYLCAQGRFGWDAVRHESRLMQPKIRVNGALMDCSWEEALSVVATNLNVIKNRYGADRIGGLGSVRTTNEDNYFFQKFMRTAVGTNNVDFLTRASYPYGLNAAYFAGDLSRLEEHDVIVFLDGAAADINPLTGIRIIRAVNRFGSRLILAGKQRTKFNGIASAVVPLEPEDALANMTAGIRNTRRAVSTGVRRAVEMLLPAEKVAIVLPALLSPGLFIAMREFADALKQVTYYPVVMRGNIQGALDMGVHPGYFPGYQAINTHSAAALGKVWTKRIPEARGRDAFEMMSGVEDKTIAALFIMGDDPVGSDPALAAVLRRLEFLVVQDIFLTETAKNAHVVLPAASSFEKFGTVTTIERRLRSISPAVSPLGESRPDWEILRDLAARMGAPMGSSSPAAIMEEIRSNAPIYRNLAVGACWPSELSPTANTLNDLSATSVSSDLRDKSTAGRLLSSSGMMLTRSKTLAGLMRPNAVHEK